jgi:hypothetical protein
MMVVVVGDGERADAAVTPPRTVTSRRLYLFAIGCADSWRVAENMGPHTMIQYSSRGLSGGWTPPFKITPVVNPSVSFNEQLENRTYTRTFVGEILYFIPHSHIRLALLARAGKPAASWFLTDDEK